MRCHHYPGRVFESKEELQTHVAKHVAIQQNLRRRGRTYGARMKNGNAATTSPSDSSSQPPILPLFNIPTTQASAFSTAQTSTTSNTQANTPSNTHETGSVKYGSVDMEFHYSLADLMRRDNSYLFFHRFSSLNVQNLLWMQSELAELEKLLADMRGVDTVNNVVAKEEAAELRVLIRERLQVYNDTLLRYCHVSKLDRPDETSFSDVSQWITDTANSTTYSPTLAQALSSDNGDHAALAQGQTQKTWAWKLTKAIL